MLSAVFNELCILAGKDLDSRQRLCIVFAGDARLPERLPRGTRAPSVLGCAFCPSAGHRAGVDLVTSERFTGTELP
ncbi:Hypothetical protein A7982_07965 [Minicystis rosea]|nr:Hypothetical protein A7982_07965 [Minicystis rosea]